MAENLQDKKEAIYYAAVKLLHENGFHSTPMSMIAKEANVAAGTIYLYYKNKDDLLNSLYLEIKKKYSSSLMEGVSDSIPVRDAFEKVWRNAVNFKLKHEAEFSVMEQFKNSPFIRLETVEEGLKIFQPIFTLVEKGQKEKILKNIHGEVLYALFFSPAGELVKTCQRTKVELTEELISSAFQGCWDAIKN
ncbi:MAG: TetR/AcrR family transcriptional regulator [Ignavibacteria bacterium]|jgi:AcrR family transcriptional regulator